MHPFTSLSVVSFSIWLCALLSFYFWFFGQLYTFLPKFYFCFSFKYFQMSLSSIVILILDISISTKIYIPLGGERESREGSEEVTEVLFLRSDLSVLCLFSVWCLSVSSFWFSVRCSLSINRSPDLWTLFCNIMFIHTMWESCSLLIFIIMFSVACEISPFTSTHTEPMRAAVLDSTHSMYQCEIQDEVQF